MLKIPNEQITVEDVINYLKKFPKETKMNVTFSEMNKHDYNYGFYHSKLFEKHLNEIFVWWKDDEGDELYIHTRKKEK